PLGVWRRDGRGRGGAAGGGRRPPDHRVLTTPADAVRRRAPGEAEACPRRPELDQTVDRNRATVAPHDRYGNEPGRRSLARDVVRPRIRRGPAARRGVHALSFVAAGGRVSRGAGTPLRRGRGAVAVQAEAAAR